jgi:hypothetical protein
MLSAIWVTESDAGPSRQKEAIWYDNAHPKRTVKPRGLLQYRRFGVFDSVPKIQKISIRDLPEFKKEGKYHPITDRLEGP